MNILKKSIAEGTLVEDVDMRGREYKKSLNISISMKEIT